MVSGLYFINRQKLNHRWSGADISAIWVTGGVRESSVISTSFRDLAQLTSSLVAMVMTPGFALLVLAVLPDLMSAGDGDCTRSVP